MPLRCATMKNNAGAKYIFCSGSNKPKPKGKNTANKKKKNIAAGMAKKSKPKKRVLFLMKNGKKVIKKSTPPRPKMNQTISNLPIKSLRRTGGGY